MRSLIRVLKLALLYRWTMAGVLASSAGAAVLWGTNLSTVFPIVDVVLQRQSMRDWVDGRIADSRQQIEELQARLATGSSVGTDGAGRLVWESRLRAEERAWKRAVEWQPWIHRFTPGDPFRTLQLVVLVLLVGTLAKCGLLVVNQVLVERLTQYVAFDLRNRLFRRVLQFDMAYFSRERASQLLSHFTHDLECVVHGTRTVLGRAILEPLKIVACCCGAAWICWRLLVGSLLLTPLAVLAIQGLARLVKRANHRALDDMAGLYNCLTESLHGILLVKAYHREEREQERFEQHGQSYLQRAMRIVSFSALTKPSNELLGMSVVGFALLAGGYLVLNEQTHLLGIRMCERPLDFGLLMTFFFLLAGVSDPARKLVDVYQQIQQAAAASERLGALMATPSQVTSPKLAVPMTSSLRSLRFSDVSFEYQAGHPVLHGLNLDIHAGETIAIVGPNGCGKSSLLQLLLRLYDPTTGSIAWNGTDLRDVDLGDLRHRIGLVTQQAFLFDDTVMANILYGAAGATPAQAEEAARQAYADQFIREQLPDGYQTVVGAGGKRLSGGQRQRIALARALVRDPQLLLLDEATSQVDAESQRLIHESLREFARNRTTILITHRAEALSLADRIVVMERGRIVDVGETRDISQRSPILHHMQTAELRATA